MFESAHAIQSKLVQNWVPLMIDSRNMCKQAQKVLTSTHILLGVEQMYATCCRLVVSVRAYVSFGRVCLCNGGSLEICYGVAEKQHYQAHCFSSLLI